MVNVGATSETVLTTPSPQEASRIEPLDGLRGVASLVVVFYHFGLGPLFRGGFVGVDWFFGLSAFLMTTMMVGEFRKTGSFAPVRFLKRRLKRLAPPALTFVLLVGLVFAVLKPSIIKQLVADGLASIFYVSNFVRPGAADRINPFHHTWSLSLEVQFYVLWATTMGLVLKKGIRLQYVAGAAAVAAVLSGLLKTAVMWSGSTSLTWLELPFFAFDRFGFGVCAAIITLDRPEKLLRLAQHALLKWVAIAFVVTDVFLAGYWGKSIGIHNIISSFCIGVVLVNLVLAPSWSVAQLLRTRPFVFLGSLSYSLYLWHYGIFELLRSGVIVDDYRIGRQLGKLLLTAIMTILWVRTIESRATLWSRGKKSVARLAPAASA
jgi:peptidoglycan/LPS O-acetylase OafA/YrhL